MSDLIDPLSLLLTIRCSVKTRLQVQTPDENSTHYTSTWDAVSTIVQEEGVGMLFHGLSANLFGTAVTNFSYYFFYDYLRLHYERTFAVEGPDGRRKLNSMYELLLGVRPDAVCLFAALIVDRRTQHPLARFSRCQSTFW